MGFSLWPRYRLGGLLCQGDNCRHSIPIIAIQVALLESEGRRNLFFTKVLDTYEEVDDGTSLGDDRKYNRDYWVKRSKWTLDTAEALQGVTQDILPQSTLNYLKHYVAVNAADYNFFWLHKRGNNKSLLGFRIATSSQDEVAGLLDANNISHVRKSKRFYVTVDQQMIEKEREVFRAIAHVMRKTREPDE